MNCSNLLSLKTRMRTTNYHFNLLSDEERLTVFLEAIKKKARGTVYDIGAGCGILSILAAPHSNFVYSIEIDPKIARLAEFNFRPFNNIILINDDAKDFIFPKKADLIICEMLDTALIDEEQVPVINSILKYLKEDGEVIPYKILNGAEIITMNRENICYEDDSDVKQPYYKIMSDFIIYNEINFKKKINENLKVDIHFKISQNGTISGIKLTTFTLLTEDIICGPTPMLNPPLLIPIEKINVNKEDCIKIELSYKMGGGLNSIQTRVERISE